MLPRAEARYATVLVGGRALGRGEGSALPQWRDVVMSVAEATTRRRDGVRGRPSRAATTSASLEAAAASAPTRPRRSAGGGSARSPWISANTMSIPRLAAARGRPSSCASARSVVGRALAPRWQQRRSTPRRSLPSDGGAGWGLAPSLASARRRRRQGGDLPRSWCPRTAPSRGCFPSRPTSFSAPTMGRGYSYPVGGGASTLPPSGAPRTCPPPSAPCWRRGCSTKSSRTRVTPRVARQRHTMTSALRAAPRF